MISYVKVDTEDICQGSVLKRFIELSDKFSPSSVTNGNAPTVNIVYRNSMSLRDDPYLDELAGKILLKIKNALPHILEELNLPNFEWGDVDYSCVSFQDGCFFIRHRDRINAAIGRRMLTWVYYLNTEPRQFTGGDLVIYSNSGEPVDRVEAQPGLLIVFRSDTLHEVEEVKMADSNFAGSRLAVTGFISARPTVVSRISGHLYRFFGSFQGVARGGLQVLPIGHSFRKQIRNVLRRR